MKIAIIAYNYSESTIPLAKHLCLEKNQVDYYYITSAKEDSASGFDFPKASLGLGIIKVGPQASSQVHSYLEGADMGVYLFRLLSRSPKFNIVNKILLWSFCRALRRKKYDIINIVGQEEILLTLHLNLGAQKTIHTLHEVTRHYDGQSLKTSLIDHLVKFNVPIIVHSRASYDALVKVRKNSHMNIRMIPFGLFETYREYVNLVKLDHALQTNNILLFYGYLRPYKGLDTLLKSISLLDRDVGEFKLLIAGSGYVPELEDAKKDERVILINRMISNAELVAINRIAKVVICPYKSASQSGIVMTSFLFEKPIIASDVGAFREVIKDGVNGMLVNPDSSVELASAISSLLLNEDRYESLADGVRDFTNDEKFSWPAISKLTLDFFEQIVKGEEKSDNIVI